MGNWIPGDPTLVAQILKISSAYTPPPPEGFISPMLWGIEANVIERFGSAGIAKENISFLRDTFTFKAPISPSEFVDRFKNYYGPTMNAFEAAEKNGKAMDLQKQPADGSFMAPPGDSSHFGNFIDAIRSGKDEDLRCHITEGFLSSALPLMANISYRTKRELKFDGKSEKFVNDKEASALLTRVYRKPYIIGEEV